MTPNQEGGYIRLYRRVWENPVFRTKQEAAVFVWMVCAAQWRETTIKTKWGPVDLGVGELIIAERGLADDFGLHRNTLRALLQRLVDSHTIELFSDRCPYHAGTICRVLNYAEYQRLMDVSEEGQDRSKTDTEADAGPIKDRSRTKNKEEKEGKEEKDIKGERKPGRSRGSQLPADWTLDDAGHRFAADKGFSPDQTRAMAEHFADHHRQRGTTSKDWAASWRTWIHNEIKFHGAPRRVQPSLWDGQNAKGSHDAPRSQQRGRRSFAEEVRAIDEAVSAGRPGGVDAGGGGSERPDGRVIDGEFEHV